MSVEQLESGKRWVEAKLADVARENGVIVTSLEWGRGEGDFEVDRLSLAYRVEGKRRVEKFYEDSLENAVNDNTVRSELEVRIKNLIKSCK